MRKIVSLVLLSLFIVLLGACSGEDDSATTEKASDIDEIVFADAGWDSIRVHNTIAQTIIENGYGYDTDVIAGLNRNDVPRFTY